MSHKNDIEFFDICIERNLDSSAILRDATIEGLKKIYGNLLPQPVREQIDSELKIAEENGYSDVLLSHRNIVENLKNEKKPFFLTGSNSALLINYALGITEINPLPPHFRCRSCNFFSFAQDDDYRFGGSSPKRYCPTCYSKLKNDGYDLQIESFLGFHHDKVPHLWLGVPSSRLNDTVNLISKQYKVNNSQDNACENFSEEQSVMAPVCIIPIENLSEKTFVATHFNMNNPLIYKKLSSEKACDCFPIPEKSELIKQLLSKVTITDFYDLFRFCGLILSEQNMDFQKSEDYLSGKIVTRETIYDYLQSNNISPETAFKIMEATRKGRAEDYIKGDVYRNLLECGITDDYIDTLKSICYLPTKAQALEFARATYINAWIYCRGKGVITKPHNFRRINSGIKRTKRHSKGSL